MRRTYLFLTVFVVACALLLQVGCQEQTKAVPEPEPVSEPPKQVAEQVNSYAG